MKRLTREEFEEKGRLVHGNKYDYSKVDYVMNKKRVCIICPIHGPFWQRPNDHLSGCGCPYCKADSKKTIIYGKYVNDVVMARSSIAYRRWMGILARCNSESYQEMFNSYRDVGVCEEWYYFSNFKKWFDENYVEGYSLDKDILVKGNRIYSPETCCFVPQEINMLVVSHNQRKNNKYGVTKSKNGYTTRISKKGKILKVGEYASYSDAIQAYKDAKEEYIREIATIYYNQGKITQNVYNALLNWEIEVPIANPQNNT